MFASESMRFWWCSVFFFKQTSFVLSLTFSMHCLQKQNRFYILKLNLHRRMWSTNIPFFRLPPFATIVSCSCGIHWNHQWEPSIWVDPYRHHKLPSTPSCLARIYRRHRIADDCKRCQAHRSSASGCTVSGWWGSPHPDRSDWSMYVPSTWSKQRELNAFRVSQVSLLIDCVLCYATWLHGWEMCWQNMDWVFRCFLRAK